MSTTLTLAGPSHATQLLPLVARFHAEFGIDRDDNHRAAALAPLLEGSPLGAAYLLGPPKAPVGYLVVSFGWSLEMGGMDAFLDEIWVRPSVRGRGIGGAALHAVTSALKRAGLTAIHLEVDRNDAPTIARYKKAGFALRDHFCLMTQRL